MTFAKMQNQDQLNHQNNDLFHSPLSLFSVDKTAKYSKLYINEYTVCSFVMFVKPLIQFLETPSQDIWAIPHLNVTSIHTQSFVLITDGVKMQNQDQLNHQNNDLFHSPLSLFSVDKTAKYSKLYINEYTVCSFVMFVKPLIQFLETPSQDIWAIPHLNVTSKHTQSLVLITDGVK